MLPKTLQFLKFICNKNTAMYIHTFLKFKNNNNFTMFTDKIIWFREKQILLHRKDTLHDCTLINNNIKMELILNYL